MVNIKLGDKVYEGVTSVKLDTAEGGATAFAPYEEAFSAGQRQEYDRFWDAYQENGKRTDYKQAFRSPFWTDDIFAPKHNIIPVGDCSEIFDNSKITDVKGICERQGVVLDFSQTTYMSNPFSSSKITRLPTINVSNIDNCSYLFNYVTELSWVDGLILRDDGTQHFGSYGSGAFSYDNKLVHCPIDGKIGQNFYIHNSSLLDDETVQSIIDALMDLTSTGAMTVQFHSTVGAKLTEEQKAVITAKNWTLVY